MTSLCGGGASGPKAGVPEAILLGSTAIGLLLQKLSIWWAIPFGVLLGQITEDASNFCATDPPADPGFNAADAAALLNVTDGAAFSEALGKLRDLVLIAAWYEFCQCTSVGTPAFPPALVLPPAGMPTTPTPSGGTCWAASYGPANPPLLTGNVSAEEAHITHELLPNTTVTTIPAGGGYDALPARAINGLGWLSVDLELTTHDTSTSYHQTCVMRFYSSSKAHLGTAIVANSSFAGNDQGPYHKWSEPVPQGTFYVSLHWYDQISPTNNAATIKLTAYCSGQGSPIAGCAPDPTVRAMLDQILGLVTLIQRQHVPFASIPGESYTGLTGNGIITLGFPCLAVRVDLTTIPSHLGYVEAEPDRLFDAGWISPGTSDAFEPHVRVSSDPFVWRVSGDVTRVGYSFPPGVVATITERRREL